MNQFLVTQGCMYIKENGELCKREALGGYNYCKQHLNMYLKQSGMSPIPTRRTSKKGKPRRKKKKQNLHSVPQMSPFSSFPPFAPQMPQYSFPPGGFQQMPPLQRTPQQMPFPFQQMGQNNHMMYEMCKPFLQGSHYPMPLSRGMPPINPFLQQNPFGQPPWQQYNTQSTTTRDEVPDDLKRVDLLEKIMELDKLSISNARQFMIAHIKTHSRPQLDIESYPISEIYKVYQSLDSKHPELDLIKKLRENFGI